MISVLVVVPEGDPPEGLEGRNPSVEVLTARGVDDTLEKLGRNRRVDAVLLLDGRTVPEIVAAILDDNPAHPPIFLPAGHRPVPGTRLLGVGAAAPGDLLDLLVGTLEP
jgi:hypothetical protein